MAEVNEATDVFLPVNDSQGNPIVLYSTTGKGRSAQEYAQALKQYNEGKGTPAGFTALPQGSFQERARTGFEKSVGTFARDTLPAVSGAVGGAIGKAATLFPLLVLAERAGLINPSRENTPPELGRRVGTAIGQFIGDQFDTPGEAGLAIGGGVASKFGAPVVGASSELLKGNLLKNILTAGGLGLAGSTTAKGLTGEEQTVESGLEDFAAAALSSGVQGVASYWLTRYLKPATATKVAGEMMETIQKKYPTLLNDPNAFNIANASPKDISNLTTMMTKALRGDVDDEATMLVENLKGSMLHRLTTGEQATLRAHSRRLIEAQTAKLDKIGDDVAFNEASDLIKQRQDELTQAVRDMYSGTKGSAMKVKNIDPTIVRVESELARHADYANTFRQGAEVLHYLKKSGAGGRFDPMKFAQEIREDYTKDPNSLLNEIGKILGQGRSLKDLPLPGEPEPGGEFGKRAFNVMRHILPKGEQWTQPLKYKGPPVPWGAPQRGNALPGIAAQEAGQAAIKSFLNREEK